jgi:hypothetical protein
VDQKLEDRLDANGNAALTKPHSKLCARALRMLGYAIAPRQAQWPVPTRVAPLHAA